MKCVKEYAVLDVADGYTLAAKLDGIQFRYRPMLRSERLRLFRSGLSDVDAYKAVLRRIVECGSTLRRLPQIETFRLLSGVERDSAERDDAQNLVDGAWLEVHAAHVARRSCAKCKVWWYDHETGVVCLDGVGRPMPRPSGSPLPCETREGCEKGTPERQKSLSTKNLLAWEHYLRCRATMSFPNDPIVTRNATLLLEIDRRSVLRKIGEVVERSIRRAVRKGGVVT